MACTVAFQAFGQALLPGAGQISPDKNVICRRAGSCFTCAAVWERLRGVVPTRLASPALEHVSVRNLATLAWMRPTTQNPVSLPTHP
jgi:hypothetical protein